MEGKHPHTHHHEHEHQHEHEHPHTHGDITHSMFMTIPTFTNMTTTIAIHTFTTATRMITATNIPATTGRTITNMRNMRQNRTIILTTDCR